MSMVAPPPAPNLEAVQRAFSASLLGREDRLLTWMADGARADRRTLLDVYRDGYALRLVEALQADFPGLAALAGPERFDALARAYVAAHPSQHASLRWLGRHLADFLQRTPPWQDKAVLAGMARFEWTLAAAWDAPDQVPLAASALLTLPAEAWATLCLVPVASLATVTLTYAVPAAWQQRESATPDALLDLAAPCSPTPWLVWRDDVTVRYRPLDDQEASLLAGLQAGESFVQLCDRLIATCGEEQAVARAATAVRGWIDLGLIGSFHHEEAAP